MDEILILIENGIVFIPFNRAERFVTECSHYGVYPCGGAIECNGQYFYL